MNFDFTEKVKVKINIYDYVENMINEFTTKLSRSDTALTTAGNNIFENVNRKSLDKNKLKISIVRYQEECLWPRYRYWIFIKWSRF